MEKKMELRVDESSEGLRIDQYIVDRVADMSRTSIKKLIDEGKVTALGKKVKASYKVQEGDLVVMDVPLVEPMEIKAEKINLDIVYEDEDVLIVNKPQGMVVHPAPGNEEGTLVNGLLYHTDKLSAINGDHRPGIVHRIDKDTSGLLIVAKSDLAHRSLSAQLKEHSVTRKYMALVEGVVDVETGIIDAPIGRHAKNRKKMDVTNENAKEARTHFRVVRRFEDYTVVECSLETGRTHQIRVHMKFINHPIVGDPVYGLKRQKLYSKGQLLHAHLVGFTHPRTNEYMEFKSELPEYFSDILEKLED